MFKSIRARIVWTFAVLVLLNLAATYWSIYNFYSIATSVTTIIQENYLNVLAAENMMKSLERQDNALLVASEGEPATPGGSLTEARDLFLKWTENRDLFFYWFEQGMRAGALPEQVPLRDSIQATYRQYILLGDSMNARIAQGAFEGAKGYYYDRIRPISDQLRNQCFTLFEINQNDLYNAMPETHSIANKTAFGAMMAAIIMLVLSIIATAWLIRSFITPAELLTERVKQIGAGNIDLKIDVLSDDEVGQLSREFNKMTERLRQYDQINIDTLLSEKRKSETIVDSITDGLIMIDASSTILHVNKRVADLFGFEEATAIGRPVTAMVNDDRVLTLLRSPLDEAAIMDDRRLSFLQFDRDGLSSFFRPKVTVLQTPDGDLYGVLLLMQDITQFKELDRMKSDFIATVSHEFRTPVTSINMSVDILDQQLLGPLTPKQKELVSAAKEDCYRLTKLARELLQLSKLESGRVQVRDEPLAMHEVVEATLRPLRIQFQEKKVALESSVPSSLPQIVADEQQLSWVITNLVTNALKYTDAGGTVSVLGSTAPGEIRLEVRDTGVGIPREHIDRIFDKFVQVRNAAGSTPGSVGLGLAIAKEIVEMYGGRIWVESEVGQGSTFAFVLPTRRPVTAAQIQGERT
ncbi:MAG: HAMP domain-containing protein [Ignavibacteriae bacterium]|nr:HAMP domain-containing protein [Ignavibacteriota bacterium]